MQIWGFKQPVWFGSRCAGYQQVGQVLMGWTLLEINYPPMEEHPTDPLPASRAPTWGWNGNGWASEPEWIVSTQPRAHSPTSTAIAALAQPHPPRRTGGKGMGLVTVCVHLPRCKSYT